MTSSCSAFTQALPINKARNLRQGLPFVSGAVVLSVLALGFLAAPVIGVVLACLKEDAHLNVAQFRVVFASPRIINLLVKTVSIAAVTALISVIIGWGIDFLLRKISDSLTVMWMTLFATGFLLSPYIYTQGWIGLVGTHGLLWKWLNISNGPSIYSTPGLIAMLVITYSPLSAVFIYLSRRLFPARVAEAAHLFQMPFWDRLRFVEFPMVRPGLVAAFLWVFVFSFWAYDVPSMLRQNLYSLEVLAAFGSFYDYGRAILLSAPPIIFTALLGCFSIFFLRQLNMNFSRIQRPSHNAFWPHILLILVPTLTWVIPFAGLFAQLHGPRDFFNTIIEARQEILNSAEYGVISSGVTIVVCLFLGFFLRLSTASSKFQRFLLFPIPWIALPGVISGMSYVHLLNTPFTGNITQNNLQLIFVQTSVILPVVMLLMLIQLASWPDQWSSLVALFRLRPLTIFSEIGFPLFISGIAATFVIGFALAIREVPASLLNYPPGGGTIAISIETMLHFDRPEKVAALCLAQTLLLFLVVAIIFTLFKLVPNVRHKLQRFD